LRKDTILRGDKTILGIDPEPGPIMLMGRFYVPACGKESNIIIPFPKGWPQDFAFSL